jgi:hypothetical protein
LLTSTESSGSIFDYIETSDTTASSQSSSQQTEDTSGSSDAPQETDSASTSDSESGRDLISQEYTSLSNYNSTLTQEAQDLTDENDELTRQLVDTVRKLEKERINGSREEEALRSVWGAAEADNKAYSRSIFVDETDEDDDEYDMQESSGMTYVIALGTVAFFTSSAARLFESKISHALRPACQKLLTSIAVLGCISVISMFLFFADAIYDEALDMRRVVLGLAMFILLWLGLGFWEIFAAQSIARYWHALEDRCIDMPLIKEQLETVHMLPRKEAAELYRSVDYAVMRQEFISPTCMTPVTEIYLRPDFDFSEYLHISIGEILAKLFTLSWVGCGLLIIAVAAWRVVFIHSDLLLYVVFGALPFLVLGTLIWMFFHLRGIFWALVPPVNMAREIELAKDAFKRQYANMTGPQADFLEGRLPPIETAVVLNRHPLKLTCAFLFSNRLPNRHELLFFLDSFGPSFLLYLTQGLLLVLTAWLVIIVLIYIPYMINHLSAWSILVLASAFLLWLWTTAFWVPEVLRLLTLTSKIHLLKDRKAVLKAGLKQKQKTELLNVRMHRQFQQIFRDEIRWEAREVLPIYMRQFIKEVFSLVTDLDKIHISQLDELLALLGAYLTEDELRVFAKECDPDARNCFSLGGIELAVKKLIHSQRLKPVVVVKTLIDKYVEENYSRRGKSELIKLETVKGFLADHNWHFIQEDIDEFLYELEFLAEEQEISVGEIAAKVKDSIEGFPR